MSNFIVTLGEFNVAKRPNSAIRLETAEEQSKKPKLGSETNTKHETMY